MPQVRIPPERVQDPFEKNVPGIGIGRDGARTPMQWDTSPCAGFSGVEPWLPLGDDWHSENVENQRDDATSIYNLYRRLIAARREHRALLLGSYRPIVARGDLLLFVREWQVERIMVALNLGPEATAVTFPTGGMKGRVLVSSFGDRDGESVNRSIDLRAEEGLVIALTSEVTIPFSIG